MSLSAILLVVFATSATISLLVAKRLTRATVKSRHPERSRHWSATGVPRIGGIAVFVSAILAILLAGVAAALTRSVPEPPELAGSLVLGSAILFITGLLDDLRGVRPFAKLLAQTAAALIVFYGGFSIEHVSLLPGYSFHLGIWSLPVTVVWLVGISNAFNLIDGLDGLAGGVALIALGAVVAAAVTLGNPSVPVYTVALVGALLGFLKYNWPPARLFMGDSGSLVVGFVLAVLAVKGATDAKHVTYGVIPIFALAYPLLDTGVAILRRWLRGVPLSRADRRHVHHQLASVGLGPRKALFVIYVASATIATIGLLAALAPSEVTALSTLVGVGVLFLVSALGIYWLQYHEFLEAGASFAHAIKKSRSVIQDKINARDLSTVLREARSIEEIQALLRDHAETFRFAHMKLSDHFSRKQAAGRVTQELQTLKLWKLEYPILQRASDEYDGLCLSIWSAISNGQQPAGAERVARILAPAIAEWIGGRKRTLEETRAAERGIGLNGAHPTSGDRSWGTTYGTDLRLFELEKPAPEKPLEA